MNQQASRPAAEMSGRGVKVSRNVLASIAYDELTVEQLTGVVGAAVEDGGKVIIGHHNLHSLWLLRVGAAGAAFRKFYGEADVIHADGMGVILLAQLLGCHATREHRIGYLDWCRLLFSAAEGNRWRLCFVGGRPGVGEAARRKLRKHWPMLKLHCEHGFFEMGTKEEDLLIHRIRSWCPDVVLVGMGMPRQERWILEHYDELDAHAFLPCGGFFDYLAGLTEAPPRWVGRLGLEWAFRTFHEPKRLFRRNIIGPLQLLDELAEAASKGLLTCSRETRLIKLPRELA